MLKSFNIKNFRLFKEVSIPELNRVNLFVGNNNSGKTALLEALNLYAANGSLECITGLIDERQESWDSGSDSNDNSDDQGFFRHLFNGHIMPEIGDEGIVLEAQLESGERQKLKLSTYGAIEEKVETGLVIRRFVNSTNVADPISHYVLMVKNNDKVLENIRLDYNLRDLTRLRSRPSHSKRTNGIEQIFENLNYVSTNFVSKGSLGRLWDAIALTEHQEEVVSGLQIIDPKISGLVFVNSRTTHYRIPLVKLSDKKERLPLRSMGDGLFRLFYIILALINSKNGCLLIDEFENGIHWSVQEQLWSVVFKLASKLNVQVFVTTHSRDCIKAFGKCWAEHGEDTATFYRVNNTNERKIRKYHFELLNDSLDTDVEVR